MPLYNGDCVSFPWVNWQGIGVNHPPHLASSLKNGINIPPTLLPLFLNVMLRGDLYLCLTSFHCCMRRVHFHLEV